MKIVYGKYNNDRLPRFQTQTIIFEQNKNLYAKKKALHEEGNVHIRNIHSNFSKLSRYVNTLHLAPCSLVDNEVVFEYQHGKSLDSILIDLVIQKNKSGFLAQVSNYKQIVENCTNGDFIDFKVTKEFSEVFGEYEQLTGCRCLPISNIDLIFDNIIVDQEQIKIIDYEWVFEFPIPIEYIIYRAIAGFYFKYKKYLQEFITLTKIFDFLNIHNISLYEELEFKFHNYVGKYNCNYLPNYRKNHEYMPWNEKNGQNYTMQMFVDDGSETFSESNSLKQDINIQNSNFTFSLSEFSKIASIRIDPLECNCIVKIVNITLIDSRNNCHQVKDIKTNATYHLDDIYMFIHADPQLYITNLLQQDVKAISIHIEFKEVNFSDQKYLSLAQIVGEKMQKSLVDNEEGKIRAQLFVDTGNGFNEENSIIQNVQDSQAKMVFDIHSFQQICGLRFDPHDNSVVVEIVSIKGICDQDVVELAIDNSNAVYAEGSTKYFLGQDPQLYIGLDKTFMKINQLSIAFRYHQIGTAAVNAIDNFMQNKLQEDKRQLHMQQQVIEAREQTIKEITGTKGYKVLSQIQRGVNKIHRK